MSDPFERYNEATAALDDYDRNAGQDGWDSDESDRREREKYDAGQNVSVWTKFWNS